MKRARGDSDPPCFFIFPKCRENKTEHFIPSIIAVSTIIVH